MQVMNYYALTPEELELKIEQIRNWLFDHPNDKRYKKAMFALDVALYAKELEVDSFTQLVLDNLI